MSSDKRDQTMKPLTAANKLRIYLPAAPEEFRESMITQAQLDELRQSPPEWLEELRREGPFPRDVVAEKLGITNAGLGRSGVGDALTATQIDEIIAESPAWLTAERENYAQVQAENERVRLQQEEKRASSNRPPKDRFGRDSG